MLWRACARWKTHSAVAVPKNAELIRNLMFCAQYAQDHVVHFYHLHALDWVDVVSALKADPQKTSEIAVSISPWPKSSPKYFAGVQQKLKAFVESGQLGIFANGYWGNPSYKLPPEVNLLAVTHYLEALEWQREIVKIHTIFGGKNPHPNYLVGGVPCSINPDEVNAINMDRLNFVGSLINQAIAFVEQVYIPDLMAIAGFYKDWAAIGGGLKNYLAYGDLPTRGYGQPDYFKFARGAILDRNLNEVYPVNGRDAEEIKEYISHSWYSYGAGDAAGLHPFAGETEFNYTGPMPPYEQLNVEGKYSWLKTPRWKDHAMEVGPLARLLVSLRQGQHGGEGRGERRPGQAGGSGDGAVLDARSHGRTRAGDAAHRALDEGLLRRPDDANQGGRTLARSRATNGSRQPGPPRRKVLG